MRDQPLPHAAAALRLAGAAIGDFMLPPVCPGCRRATGQANALCPSCWGEIRFIERPFCQVYGTPFAYDLGEGALSAEAMADPPPFGRCRSAVLFGDVTQRIVHELKYHDRPEVADFMVHAMARAGRELLDSEAVLIPVPLHRWRLWRRRFNQSALLSARLAELAGVRHEPGALLRVKATRQQVGLNSRQRSVNVQGAFLVPEAMRIRIQGRHVVLVDDVYTSGATVKAVTRTLLRAGAGTVDVLTFARVAR